MNRAYKYIISYITIVYIVSSSIVVPSYSQEPIQTIDNLAELVPATYGSIRDSYFAGGNHGIIVHIQDLHCNYDAQMSIYHIIDELIEKYGLDLVTVEGSVGKLEKTALSHYPNKHIKEEVAKYFIKIGRINGPAYAHVMRNANFSFYGADNKKLHKDNVEAFKASLKSKDTNIVFHNNISSIIDDFKSKAYSKDLKELDNKINAYKNENLDFSEYIGYLRGLLGAHKIDNKEYPNFIGLNKVLEQEAAIDFLEVDNQRSAYIGKLNEVLEKNELSELLDNSLYFKTGKLSALSFYTYLRALSEKDNTPAMDEEFAQLAKYIDYLTLYSEIENITLFKEIEQLEKALKEKMFRNHTERTIDKIAYNLGVLKDLFNLKLTKETLQHYRDNRKEFMASYFINFISENAPRYKIKYKLDPVFRKLDAQLPDFERFYSLAEERDSALVYNTLKKMNEKRSKMAVLVSGGFHTDGITRLLKDKKVSYVVITPKVDKLQEDNPYRSVILGEKDPLDEFYEMYLKNITESKQGEKNE
ncbi:MAG: hypothetical protein HQ572_02955 [Candidatus Omnitrophica bacterium]|nr:hypothetical protein [Candidatus Omnitrophota bacterium]